MNIAIRMAAWVALATGIGMATALAFAKPQGAGSESRPGSGNTGGFPVDMQFSTDRLWDDGKAEIAIYAATRTIYGKVRKYEWISLTVKEEMDPRQFVKSDVPGAPGNLPVLKCNIVQRIETENYPYHFLTSVFVDRLDPRRCIKETSASQEWCGNTFQSIVTNGAGAVMHYHSYWDGEGDGSRDVGAPPGGVMEDALPLALRGSQLVPGVVYPFPMFPSRMSTKIAGAAWVVATVVLQGEETLRTPAGVIECERFEVSLPGSRRDHYWIEKAMPRALVRFEQPGLDGRSGVLQSRERRAYW